MTAASSCLKDRGDYFDYYPYPDYFLMTLSNDTDIPTVWFIPEKGEGLPDEKPTPDEGSQSCFPLDKRSSKDIYVSEKVTHPTQTYGPEETVPIYVFEAEFFESASWDEIKADADSYIRFELTVEGVVKDGRKVPYTGN